MVTREEIEARNFDLKAVNPHARNEEDTRTPEELLDLVEAKRLRGSRGSGSIYEAWAGRRSPERSVSCHCLGGVAMVSADELLEAIQEYPTVKTCFEDYIRWLCENNADQLDEYDLIWAITRSGSREGLKRIEAKFNDARRALGVSVSEFCKLFGVHMDLHEPDPEKLHDLLAETFTVADLAELGFTDIKRIETSTGKQKTSRAADLTASWGSEKFAIEIKSARKVTKPGQLAGGSSYEPSWWRTELRTILRRKSKSSLEQLDQTATTHRCDKQMLIVVSHKIGTMFMDVAERIEDMKAVKPEFPAIDYFGYTDMEYYWAPDSSRILFYPNLPPKR
jgi:hypothetical protein